MLTALLIIAFFILCTMYARRAQHVRRRQAHKTLRTYNEMTRWTEEEQRNLSAHLSENDPLYEVARLEFRSNERALHEQELERMKLARVLRIPLEEARRI